MQYSELRHASLERPEQVLLSQELKKRGIENEIEKKVWRDTFYCNKHRQTETKDSCQDSHLQFYLMDLYLVQNKINIELDGESHGSGNQQAKDFKRTEFLKTLGIRTVRLDKYIFLNRKGQVQHDRIIEIAELIAELCKKE